MNGENFVILSGKIKYIKFKELDNNNYMFKARLYIPIDDKYQIVKVGAWGTIAEDLGVLPEDTFIRLHGHIEESSYEAPCRYCKSYEKKYWTEVIIDNYIII